MKLLKIVVVLLVSGSSEARPQGTGKNRDLLADLLDLLDKTWNILSGKNGKEKADPSRMGIKSMDQGTTVYLFGCKSHVNRSKSHAVYIRL